MKNLKLILTSEIIYLFLIFIWTGSDFVNFGIGLGGLFFYYLSIASSIILGIVLFVITRIKDEKKGRKVLVAALIMAGLTCLMITYYFTIGRGMDCPWDGIIFNPC